MKQEKKYWLDDSRNVTKIFYTLVTVCVLLVLSDLLYHKHYHYSWEGWLGFHGFYGFFGSVGLVLTAKQLRKILMRKDDYYDR
jgi:hypothetical protein